MAVNDEPVPWFQLSLLFIALAAHATTMTMPFPFLPFMVKVRRPYHP
jgi:hypothetical protein